MQQTTGTVLMVPPYDFAYNTQTAVSNHFQRLPLREDFATLAMQEYEGMVQKLRTEQIQVLELTERAPVPLPDAVFPNNWFSIHYSGQKRHLWLYPMLTPNRRLERRQDLLITVLQEAGFHIDVVHDITAAEQNARALEGTGSLVFDHEQKVVFAALSPRTEAELVESLAKEIGYQTCCFHSFDTQSRLIYHTNLLMSIGKQFVLIALETVEPAMRQAVRERVESLNKQFINIDQAQVLHMCGNILEVKNAKDEPYIIMSSQAHQHFSASQLRQLELQGQLLIVDIPTIEAISGGGARCMLAEIF